jgi:hypothetical protein
MGFDEELAVKGESGSEPRPTWYKERLSQCDMGHTVDPISIDIRFPGLDWFGLGIPISSNGRRYRFDRPQSNPNDRSFKPLSS